MAWAVAFDDTFARADTSAGAAGSTTGVGNGWTDVAGGVWSLAGGKLVGSTADTSPTSPFKALLRPTGEAAGDSRITATFAGTSVAVPGMGLRLQTNGNYLMGAVGNGAAFIFSVIGGTLTQLAYANLSAALVAGHTYAMDFQATGATPTALAFTLTDVTAGGTLASLTASSSEASVQGTGRSGFVTWSNSGSTSVTYSEATTYTLATSPPVGTITVSPTSLTAGTSGQAVAVTGSGASLSGTTFTLSGGLGAALTAQAVSSATAASLTLNPGAVGGGAITVTNSAGGTAAITVNPPNLGPLRIGFVGDSITAGTNGDPVSAMAAYLTGQGYTVMATNRAVSGTSTADWVNGTGGANLPAAVSAFQAAGVTVVQVMLGTNDWRQGLTVAQHVANMRAIVAALRAACLQVLLNKSPWAVPNGAVGGLIVPPDHNDRTMAAWRANVALCDGINVFASDTTGFEWSMLTPAVLDSYGLHPKDAAQNAQLGQYWAVAFMGRYGAAGIPNRWTH